ncbi:MAG TPA: ABC transporter permease, partial [Edaphobacter sp.]|nr:ABC transporter permease [Edaphobacter sp.]
MRSLWQDLQYAVRQLRNAPVFALTAIFTLALGIGMNAAMFSVVDQVLLRAMPFPRANEVVQMGGRSESGTFAPTSLPDIEDWRTRSHSFEQISYFTGQASTLGGTASPKLVGHFLSSANLFDLLEAKPMMGRTFLPRDGEAGQNDVVILGASIWREFYHADRNILGRTVPINSRPHTVIGVMPDGFSFPGNTEGHEVWTPVAKDDPALHSRDSGMMSVVGRLRTGVTLADATHELNSIHDQLVHEYPKEESTNRIQVEGYRDVITSSMRPAILALDAAVFAVWLIACANVAGLLLARGNSRRREIAVRSALGAKRSRLIRQFLTESVVMSLLGGAIGLELAVLALHLLKQYLANAVLFGDQIHIDAKVCLYLLAASCVSAMLFGLLPALHASQVVPQEGLRQGAAATGTSRGQTRWRDGLVVGEIALTLTLLVAASLMVRTLISLRHTRVGFVASQVTTGEIYLPRRVSITFFSPVPKGEASLVQTMWMPLLQQMKSLPGVQSAGLTTVRPLQASWDFNMTVELEHHPKPERSAHADAQARATTGDYFPTMGIRLLRGRLFATTDTPDSHPTVIVNHAFVQRFLPNEDPIGQQLRMNDEGDRQWATIVGVVDDSPQKSLGQAPLPEINYNLNQLLPQDDLYTILGNFYMNVAVRSSLDSATVVKSLRRVLHGIDPDAALESVESMQQVVDDSLGNQVLAARLLGLFAFSGLVIAVAGLYGLLAYSVSQRTRELGVRLALGAQREAIVWLVLRHALVLLGIGFGVGAVLMAGSGKLLTSWLGYRFSGYDVAAALSVAV